MDNAAGDQQAYRHHQQQWYGDGNDTEFSLFERGESKPPDEHQLASGVECDNQIYEYFVCHYGP